ncbi:MAG: hypothetical protein LC127_00345 [Chitinophagales bacterium]|nr:hypothetical protein [Chitinophagales bacterium]
MKNTTVQFIALTLLMSSISCAYASFTYYAPLENNKGGSLPTGSIGFNNGNTGGNTGGGNGTGGGTTTPTSPTSPTNPDNGNEESASSLKIVALIDYNDCVNARAVGQAQWGDTCGYGNNVVSQNIPLVDSASPSLIIWASTISASDKAKIAKATTISNNGKSCTITHNNKTFISCGNPTIISESEYGSTVTLIIK